MDAPALQCHDPSRRLKVGPSEPWQQQRKRSTTLPNLYSGPSSRVLDKHEGEHTLTPEILETLAQAYAAAVTGGVPDQPRLGS